MFQSFKLNVDARGALKEGIMEEGSALLSVLPSHQSGTHTHTHTRTAGQVVITES